MNILVTGSEGNIGRNLVPYLREEGHTVYRNDIISGIGDDYIQADVCGPDLLDKTAGIHIDVVYHLAAMVSRVTCEATPYQAMHTNICGTNNIIQLCKKRRAHLINFSTSEVYGNTSVYSREQHELTKCRPNNRYGLSKYIVEQIVDYETLNYELSAINVRPFMIYDPYETMGCHRSAMIRFAEYLIKKKSIVVHKEAKRGWLHIFDAVRILGLLATSERFMQGIINIGNPDVRTIREMAEIMCAYLYLNPNDYIIEEELPDRMTLEKIPSLERQKSLGYKPQFQLEYGIKIVLDKMRERLG